jgi:hypothetical protein
MSIYKPQPVSQQPHVTLIRWSVIEVDDKERHFVGRCLESDDGRVSSAIESFDAKAMRGVTRSGRVYQLEGPDAFDLDAAYVWQWWCEVNAVKTTRDVSKEILRGK